MNLYTQTKGRIVGNEVVDKSIQEASDTSSGTVNEIMDDEPDMWEQGLDYILDALEQIILGNFTDESNLLGIIGSVLIGCTPVGIVADIRDILADIYNLATDGAETSEWISLGLDLVALIPLCDLLKHGDKLDELGMIIEAAQGQWKADYIEIEKFLAALKSFIQVKL